MLLLIALLSVLSPALAGDRPETLQVRSADREVLEQAIAESRSATSPSPPGVSRYVSDAGITFSTWLAEAVDRLLPGFSSVADWFLAASWGLLVSVLIVLLVFLGAGLARRWWRERSRSRPAPAVTALPAAATSRPRSAERWEEEIRRRIAGGDVAAAVEALWWWLASVLVGSGVEPSWTSRELVTRAGRTDLRPQIRRLDRMIYGRVSPPAEDVRRLFRDLREAA
ncbi:MAG: hypothetical protein V3T72_04170 [Thermoanaerobaculia bacterium]